LAGAGLALVASGVSYALVASTSTRLAGETITGQALGPEVIESDLATAANDANKNNILGAVKEYQKILASDPTEPDALTGEGWLLAQSGQPSLLQQGLQLLALAEQYDPTYAPAHVYRGLALLVEDDYQDSIPELKWYLAHSPEPQLVPSVNAALQKAEAGAAAAAKASG
jgi:tetratricopeptide (TPR) repeat protein